MKRLMMAEQWDAFSRALNLSEAPQIQRQEMRRAFYAGAQGILFGVIAVLVPDAAPTIEDLVIMTDLSRELSDFADLVKAGRA